MTRLFRLLKSRGYMRHTTIGIRHEAIVVFLARLSVDLDGLHKKKKKKKKCHNLVFLSTF